MQMLNQILFADLAALNPIRVRLVILVNHASI